MRFRQVLFALVSMIALSGAPTMGEAQPAPAAVTGLPFVLKQVGPGVYAAIDGPEHRSGSNAGFVIGDDGVLVIDSFYNPDAAKALLAEIRKLTPKPVRYVVNTHYHLDHVSGDAVFKDAGAIIVAHRNVHGWIHDQTLRELADNATAADRARVEALPYPDVTTAAPMTIWLGARRINLQPMEGHTGGDLAVGVPDAKVIFCGDILWNHRMANTTDGTVAKWIDSLALFQRLPDAATMSFVPGHGEVATAKDVAAFQAYLSDLSSLTAEARRGGLQADAEIAAVLAKFKALHPDWPGLDLGGKRQIMLMDQELAGTKPVPKPE